MSIYGVDHSKSAEEKHIDNILASRRGRERRLPSLIGIIARFEQYE